MTTCTHNLSVRRPLFTMTAFGEWLREKRQAARMSQDDLADAADCSKSYVSNLERGLHHTTTGAPPQPSKKMVEALAIALGASVQEALSVAFAVPAGRAALDPEFPDDPIDFPAMQAFLEGLPRTLQQEEYERVKRFWLEHRRGQTDFGKKADEE